MAGPDRLTDPIAAIVLAAGRSRRMGQDKALLAWDGGTVLGAVRATLAAAGADPVRVVLGPDAPDVVAAAAIDPREVVVNPTPDAGGQLRSLQLGLAALAPFHVAGVLVWPVDHPGVPAPVVTELIDRWRRAPQAPLARPVVGARGGHPTLFGAELFGELQTAPPDQGARAVVHAHRDRELRLPCREDAVVRDLDTPEDYEAARG